MAKSIPWTSRKHDVDDSHTVAIKSATRAPVVAEVGIATGGPKARPFA